MYLISCTLKRYEEEGRQAGRCAADAHWAIWDAMYKAQEAFDGVIANFPVRFIAALLYRIIFPWGHPYDVPSDEVGHQVAKLLIEPSATRDRLTAETYLPKTETEPSVHGTGAQGDARGRSRSKPKSVRLKRMAASTTIPRPMCVTSPSQPLPQALITAAELPC
jgi:hypothetical protein